MSQVRALLEEPKRDTIMKYLFFIRLNSCARRASALTAERKKQLTIIDKNEKNI